MSEADAVRKVALAAGMLPAGYSAAASCLQCSEDVWRSNNVAGDDIAAVCFDCADRYITRYITGWKERR